MAGTEDYRKMLSDVAGELTSENAKDLALDLPSSAAERSRISNARELIQEMERINFVSQDDVDKLLKLLERKNFNTAAGKVMKYINKKTPHSDDLATQRQSSSEIATKSTSSENAPEKRKVDIKYFEELSGKLEDDWKVVGRKLKLENGDLSNIERDHPGNLKEAKYQMLCKWLQKNGSAATYQNLASAFMEANKVNLAEAILKHAANH